MNGLSFGLVVDVQTKAASYVVDFETEFVDIADTLEADIAGQSSHVNGTYMSILGEALAAWGETDSPHVEDQNRYTQALTSADEAFITAEE